MLLKLKSKHEEKTSFLQNKAATSFSKTTSLVDYWDWAPSMIH